MRKRRAIRAALILRRWCKNTDCDECPFHRNVGGCKLDAIPCLWQKRYEPTSSLGEKVTKLRRRMAELKEDEKNATD